MHFQKIFALVFLVLSFTATAQTNPLKCFASAKPGEELQAPRNEMKTPAGFSHLKGQSFQKTLKLRSGSTIDLLFTLRVKGGEDFDFRINSTDLKDSLHLTASLDSQDMFQYTNYASGFAVLCTKDY
ncbi:MAG: hypothetical protein ACLGG7_04655 [Bacteriovoracia bacterium]